jgi:hypothetical protein
MVQNISAFDHDHTLLLYTACIADAILKPLYHFIHRRNLFGYVDTLHEIASWAIQFHNDYRQHMLNWDEFEESDFNIYNSTSWDDFLICWANDQFEKFKASYKKCGDPLKSDGLYHGGSKACKLVVVIEGNKLSAVYSDIPVQVAHLVSEKTQAIPFRLVEFLDSDTLADRLYTLFDPEDPNQSSVRELLRTHGF